LCQASRNLLALSRANATRGRDLMDLRFTTGRREFLAGLGAVGLAGCRRSSDAAETAADSFVRVDGMGLVRGGEPYRFVGANAWYLAWLGSDTRYGDRARLTRELERMRAAGIANLRIMASGE